MMRSLVYLTALLPLFSVPALGKPPHQIDDDDIEIVTVTRTVTICPITEIWTCHPDFPTGFPSTSITVSGVTTKPTHDHSHGSPKPTSSTSPVGPGSETSSSPTSPEYPTTTESTTSKTHGGPFTTTTTTSEEGGEETSSTTKTWEHPGTTTTSEGSGEEGSSSTKTWEHPETTTSEGGGEEGSSSTTKTWGHPETTTTSEGTGEEGSSSTTKTWEHPETTTTSAGNGEEGSSSTTATWAHPETTTTSAGNGEEGSSSTTATWEHPETTTTSAGNGGESSTSSASTTTYEHPETTSSVSQSTIIVPTSTEYTSSSASCPGATKTASGIPTPSCNTEKDRSVWCGTKSVDDDTHKVFFTRQTKKYQLTITNEMIDFDGTPRPAFAINGQTPGEPIVANWGDMVEIEVTNGLTDNATTIHWHGIRQFGTNDQDGVPGVTECAIAPGTSRTYTWHASSFGTGWYHAHTLAQYGGGIRGPIIIHGPATEDYDLDMGTVMVDERFDQTVFQVAYNVARVRGPLPPSANYLLNGKNKSPDGTKGESAEWTVKPGKKHLFRIINSSAQSAYAVRFDNHKFKVISADFTPIVPYETDTLWIQSGQRYNVVVEMDQPAGAYYLRAVTQTGCGVGCINDGLGTSNGIFTYEGSCGTPTPTTVNIVTAGDCKDEPYASLVPRVPKNAGTVENFEATVKLLPGGNAGFQAFGEYGSVIRWFLGDMKSLSENSGAPAGNKGINVTFDQPTLKTLATMPSLPYNSSIYSNMYVLDGPPTSWVYFVIQNNFQTSHPMHLHGHDFAVLGEGKGVFTADMVNLLKFDNPIRRDTNLLFGLPNASGFTSGWTVIGLEPDNPGAWVMHCHIIWHADGGMGLQFLERPSDIDADDYYTSAGFQNECANYEAYEEAGGELKAPYEAGIKRRHLHSHRRKAF